jgi:hypothetical protein
MDLIPYARACEATYDPAAIRFAEDPARLTHLYLSEIDGAPCFAFEGTSDPEEWLWRDFLVIGVGTFEHPAYGPIHDGIAKGAIGILPAITDYLAAGGWPPFALAGHSKGAGEAIIAAAELKRIGRAPRFFAAFEAPHVGGPALRAWLADVAGAETATFNAHGRDLVTMVPWATPALRWESAKDRIALPVPDDLGMADKHRIPAVLGALGVPAAPGKGAGGALPR